jgi:SAM-dependent methyltransferase
MNIDTRLEAARFYDSNPDMPNDIPFYQARIPAPAASILELGCGTGRVTLALAPHCSYIHGLDLSPAMLSICREKLAKADLPSGRVRVEEGDITDFDLARSFDLIIAPFRVLQNLETDAQLDGLFESFAASCARRKLHSQCVRAENGAAGAAKRWGRNEEELDWKWR